MEWFWVILCTYVVFSTAGVVGLAYIVDRNKKSYDRWANDSAKTINYNTEINTTSFKYIQKRLIILEENNVKNNKR